MLEPKWEKLAEALIDASDVVSFLDDLNENRVPGFELGLDIFSTPKVEHEALVFTGHDTRESSTRLISAVCEGIRLMKATAVNCNLVTTPQLHWLTQ